MFQLSSITERMVRSLDVDVNGFIDELDQNLAASRSVFSHFDSVMNILTDDDWERIQLKVSQCSQ